jgi:hypothetical protein
MKGTHVIGRVLLYLGLALVPVGLVVVFALGVGRASNPNHPPNPGEDALGYGAVFLPFLLIGIGSAVLVRDKSWSALPPWLLFLAAIAVPVGVLLRIKLVLVLTVCGLVAVYALHLAKLTARTSDGLSKE